MAAYVVGRLQMRDPSWIEKYRATVPSIVAKHDGKYLVRGGKMETLEGKEPLPSSYVVIEFPSMDQARAADASMPPSRITRLFAVLRPKAEQASNNSSLPGTLSAIAFNKCFRSCSRR